jgi:hypothetical protein
MSERSESKGGSAACFPHFSHVKDTAVQATSCKEETT